MRRSRGFTLIEAMVAVAIVGVLAGLSIFALRDAVRMARLRGDRFTVMRLIGFAKSRAVASGRDVYVIFADLDQTVAAPNPRAPRVLVYEDDYTDVTASIRAKPTEILKVAEDPANAPNVRERLVSTAQSGLHFRAAGTAQNAADCTVSAAKLPGYVTVTGARRTQRNCAPVTCTFCEKQNDFSGNSACVGALRFSADGTARLVTGPTDGRGGFLRMVDSAEIRNTICIGLTEPAGVAVSLRD